MKLALGAVGCALSLLLAMQVSADADASGGGTQRWAASYQQGAAAFTNAVTVSPDGRRVFVTGVSHFGPDGRFATLAYEASTGDRLWAVTFPGAASGEYGMGWVLTVSPNGSTVFVSGYNDCTSGCDASSFEGFSTLAYDARTGKRLWMSRLAASGGAPTAIQVSPDGSTVFLSATDGDEGSEIAAYDAVTGEQRWVVERQKASGLYGGGLTVSPDGATIYVIDTAPPDYVDCFYSGGYRTTALDTSNGAVRWSSRYTTSTDGSLCGTPTALGLSPDGTAVYVAGYGSSTSGGSSGLFESGTVAYSAATGDELWSTIDDRIRVLDGDTVVSLGVAPDGASVFVSGDGCIDYPACSIATVALDTSTGAPRWASAYDGGGRGYANDLAVSPNGASVLVTGQETMPCLGGCTFSQIDAPLVAYDAETGAERWATTYADNLGRALAVSPDGSSVYLAGTFTTAGSTARSGATVTAKGCGGRCGYSTARYNLGRGPGAHQESDPSLTYEGWRGFFHKTAVGGAYRASNQAGDTASFHTPRVARFSWLTHQGPDQGKAKIVVDGHNQGVFDLYSTKPTARSITFTGIGRHKHDVRIMVLGRKRPTSTGTWVALDGFRYRAASGVSQESSPEVRYGSWTAVASPAAHGGTLRRSNSPGARLRLNFTGRGITWITATGPAYGRARVTIDRNARVVDLNRPTQHWGVSVRFTGLAQGDHHITITRLASKHPKADEGYVAVDALVVRD